MEKILASRIFNNEMENKIAEFIEIMLGDGNFGIYQSKVGNIIKKQHRIKISLDSQNEEYTNYVINLLKEILKVEPKLYYKKKENSVDIGIYRKDKFFYVLNEVGLKISPKWNNMEIPEKYFQSQFFPIY